MLSSRALLIVVAAVVPVLLSGCPREATQVLVTFVADPMSASRVQLFRVHIRAQDQEVRLDRTVPIGGAAAEVTLPTTVPVSPLGGDASRVFHIEGELIENEGTVFAEQRAIVGFVEHQPFEVLLRFDDECIDRFECSPNQTCREGRCVDAYVPRPGEDVEPEVAPAPCPVDPCRPTAPQCGCDVGEACRGLGESMCTGAGPMGLGEPCEDAIDCNGGLTCWGLSGEPAGQCVAYCEQGADCPGGFCLGNPAGAAGVCLPLCTPLSGEDCPDALSCSIIFGPSRDDGERRAGSICTPAGGLPVGASCGGAVDRCEPEAICASGVCLELCVLDEGLCTMGGRCQTLSDDMTIGDVTYGACY